MNYYNSTGKSIEQSFAEFHKLNPDVYALFQQYAFYLLRTKGKKKISSKLIINRIRWEKYLETNTDDPYRINDAYTAHYARLFAHDHPEFKDCFEFRQLRAVEPVINSIGQYELAI